MSDCPYCYGMGGKSVIRRDDPDGHDWIDCPACGGTGDYTISDRRVRAALLGNDDKE